MPIKATTHRIELTQGAKKSFQPPYRAGLSQIKHEKKEIERMSKVGVIEPSTSELAAPVVFAPKKMRNTSILHLLSTRQRDEDQ